MSRNAHMPSDHTTLRYRTKYHHQPLDENRQQIRLLRLRHELSENGLIQCDISTFDLATAPEYQALSYEWGRPRRMRCIGVGGKLFLVRENLWLFLKMFRLNVASNILLWVDQICIDQHNIAERGHQVRLMGEIYTKALRAVVWLGPSTGVYTDLQATFDRHKHLDFAVPAKEDVFEHCQDHTTRHDQAECADINCGRLRSERICTDGRCALCYRLVKDEAVQKNASSKVQKPELMLKDLCELTYWDRLWIVQENILAQDCMFFLGQSQYSRSDIYEYARLHQHRDPTQDRSAIIEHIQLLTIDDQFRSNLSLDEAFRRYETTVLKCLDPRDLVYGILGMVQPTHGILVDYQSTTMEVFGRLMDMIILSPSLEKTLAGDNGEWLGNNLADIATALGLTPIWESWLGPAETLEWPLSPVTEFLRCLSSLVILGLQRTRWTPYELGSIIHTARIIEHTLLPPYASALGKMGEEESLHLAINPCTRFVDCMNEVASADLPQLLLDMVEFASPRNSELKLTAWYTLFDVMWRRQAQVAASEAIE